MKDIVLNNFELTLAILVLGGAVLIFIGWFLARRVGSDKIARADETAAQIIRDAEKEAEMKKKEALLKMAKHYIDLLSE